MIHSRHVESIAARLDQMLIKGMSMLYCQKKNQKGFTLVELSIVIVIIGLIVAGVVAGGNLVKQAQLRSIISEQEQIRVALSAFKLEYDAIPGDMSNGSSYWANACRADGGSGASVVAECNGDANKRLLVAADNTSESYMAWTHLTLASLYSGSFVPTLLIPGSVGSNIPASKFSGVGITLIYDDAASDASAGDGGTAGRNLGKNIMLFGADQAAGTGLANGTAFTAAQAQGIDDKVDDGSPVVGIVIGVGESHATNDTACIDSDTDVYNLDSTVTPCAIAFTF